MQVTERGIAGAEIVERDTHALVADMRQRAQGGLVIVEQRGLGNLKFEPFGGKPRIGQCLRNGLRQARVEQLDRRYIDSEVDVFGPARCILAGAPQYVRTDAGNKAELLRDRDEFGGRYFAMLGASPSQQRLRTRNLALGRGEDRLINDLELVAHRRAA